MFKRFMMVAVLTIGVSWNTHAGLIPISATRTAEGDGFRYTYGVQLTSSSLLQKGDGFVIYDFDGFVDGSNLQPSDFIFSTSMTGGSLGLDIPDDDASIPNLIFTYDGDTPLFGEAFLGEFSAATGSTGEGNSQFAGSSTFEDAEGNIFPEDNVTPTIAPVAGDPFEDPNVDPTDPIDPGTGTGTGGEEPTSPPGVPEPTSLILLAAGLPLWLGARKLRKA